MWCATSIRKALGWVIGGLSGRSVIASFVDFESGSGNRFVFSGGWRRGGVRLVISGWGPPILDSLGRLLEVGTIQERRPVAGWVRYRGRASVSGMGLRRASVRRGGGGLQAWEISCVGSPQGRASLRGPSGATAPPAGPKRLGNWTRAARGRNKSAVRAVMVDCATRSAARNCAVLTLGSNSTRMQVSLPSSWVLWQAPLPSAWTREP